MCSCDCPRSSCSVSASRSSGMVWSGWCRRRSSRSFETFETFATFESFTRSIAVTGQVVRDARGDRLVGALLVEAEGGARVDLKADDVAIGRPPQIDAGQR